MTRTDSTDSNGDWSGFTPALVLHVDIGQPIPALSPIHPASGRRYRRAVCFVRLHTQLLGTVDLPLAEEGLSGPEWADKIWSALAGPINNHLREDGLAPLSALPETGIPEVRLPRCLEVVRNLLADPPLVSVVVSTRDRPETLQRCLRSILSLAYPNYEVIVVDNAPRTSATRELVSHLVADQPRKLRYVQEDRPGLSSARNRGLAESTGSLIAFTDDDVIVDRHWLTNLVAGFRWAPSVACVTGNILPLELETPAQAWMEQSAGFSKGSVRTIYDLEEHRPPGPLYPYTAGVFGSGANLAFAIPVLREIGGFDPALSVGTEARGGEDLAAFFAIVTRGYRLVYEPSAIVQHQHYREFRQLRNQVYGYGIGLTAYLTKCLWDEPSRMLEILRRVPQGIAFVAKRQSQRDRINMAAYSRDLAGVELRGMAYGPFAYLRSRWRARRQANALNLIPLPKERRRP